MKKLFSFSFTAALVFSLIDSLNIVGFDKRYFRDIRFLSVVLFLFFIWFIGLFVSPIVVRLILKRLKRISFLFSCPHLEELLLRLFKPFIFLLIVLMIIFGVRVFILVNFGFSGLRIRRDQFKKTGKPNIFLITIDTLRADALPLYGYKGIKTPALDSIGEKAFVFKQAFSQADWTFPSLSALLTGQYPTKLDISVDKRIIPEINLRDRIDSKFNTLAELLRERGYYTQAILTNPWLSGEHHGFSQGFIGYYNFDSFERFFYRDRGKKAVIIKIIGRLSDRWKNNLVRFYQFITESFGKGYEIRGQSLVNSTLPWLDKVGGKSSFFLWLHFFDPHAPYDPPENYLSTIGKDKDYLRYLGRDGTVRGSRVRFDPEDKKLLRQLYQREIEYLDTQLARLFSYLKERGLFDQSLIIITSDHGEAFWERGFQGHGKNFYNEEIHVPLLIKLPKQREKVLVEEPVGLIRVYPFIKQYLTTDKNSVEKKKVVELFTKEPFIISEANHTGTDKKAIIEDRYKFILDLNTGERELYDYINDQEEKNNLVDLRPGIANDLEKKLLKTIFKIRGKGKKSKYKGTEELDFGY